MSTSSHEVLIPESGDFDAWPVTSDTCIAVDWDGTCKDTMVPKWTEGFNWAITEVWPQLKPHQKQIDKVCYHVNIVDQTTAGVQRFVALKIMMRKWAADGLPVPDLRPFYEAVDYVESAGEKHGLETYRRYQVKFGYDDSPLQWSDVSDRIIAESVKNAAVFPHCRETLESLGQRCDLVVVSASKTQAVRDDIVNDKMAHLFKALCAQDFLPKKQTLEGIRKKYRRVLFVGDTPHDVAAAHANRIPIYVVKVGDEATSWQEAGEVFDRFLKGSGEVSQLRYPH